MQAAQTVRAMVAVVAAGVLRRAEPAAYLAGESVGAGMGLIVTFFKGSAFILAVHNNSSGRCVSVSSGGMACVDLPDLPVKPHTPVIR